MADGEPRAKTAGADTNGSGAPAETTPVDAPTTELKLDTDHQPESIAPEAEQKPEPNAAAEATKTPSARATLAALAASIASGLAALAASIVSAAPHAAVLAKKWLTRLAEFRPSPVLTVAILGGVAALSIVGGLAHPNSAMGQACAIVFVPGLSIALGVVAYRWYSKQRPDQRVATATPTADYPALHEQRSLRFVDDRLSAAQSHLQNGHIFGALIESVRAKTATELALGTTRQPSYQGESGSAASEHAAQPSDDDDELRPRITTGNNPRVARTLSDTTALVRAPHEGSVARVEDQYTLIINRGSEHGVKPGTVFAVMAECGDTIIDPENGEVIGELPIEKLRVKVFDVQPKYSWAETFRTSTPPKVEHSALSNLASGAVDSLDTSLRKLLAAETETPRPVRTTALPEVTVSIGDRVRPVVPGRRPARRS